MLICPVESLYEVIDVFVDVGDDGSQAVFVGSAVEVERAAEEIAEAVGYCELRGRGGVALNLVECSVDVALRVLVVSFADGVENCTTVCL